MSIRDIVQQLAESDPVVRAGGSLTCGLCAVTRPESAGHINVEEHTPMCSWRRAVELLYPVVADPDEEPKGIHLVEQGRAKRTT